MSEPVIRVEGLRKSFGDREVLRGIDLEVAAGEVVVIIGPSGCGKSTLLRCLNYLEAPTQGRIWVRAELLGRQEREGRLAPRPEAEIDRQRARIGMVFQRFNLFPHMTALGNVIEAPMRVKKLPRAEAEALGAGCWSAWACWTGRTSTRRGSREASSSGWRSPGRWRWSRT